MKITNRIFEEFSIFGIPMFIAIAGGYIIGKWKIGIDGLITMVLIYVSTLIGFLKFLEFRIKNKENYLVSFEDREIFLVEKMNHKSCANLFFKIRQLNRKSCDPIKLFINSWGGDTNAAKILINAILTSKAPVVGIVVGLAHSSAAIILQVCNKRSMFPHTTLFFHDCSINVEVNDKFTAKGFEKTINLFQAYRLKCLIDDECLDNFVIKKSGISKSQLEHINERELSPEEALKLNLIDEIIKKT